MFKAELEWLYTGEGMGEVVEWLNQSAGARTADGAAAGGGGGPAGGGLFGLGVGLDVPGATVQEVGRIEGPDDHKCERLRTDLVYMWRSKLFSDVKLVLPLDPSAAAGARPAGSSVYGPDHSPNDQSLLEETTATTATFTTHKFILASRSPYFAQLLLNPGGFRSVDPAKGEIKLPSPPFTPASMHFCLGFMCAPPSLSVFVCGLPWLTRNAPLAALCRPLAGTPARSRSPTASTTCRRRSRSTARPATSRCRRSGPRSSRESCTRCATRSRWTAPRRRPS